MGAGDGFDDGSTQSGTCDDCYHEDSEGPRRDGAQEEKCDLSAFSSLHDALTLILVTSPIRSHPSTEMLENTLRSYVVGGKLAACEKVIVSDGCYACEPGQRERQKHGRVPRDWLKPYAAYRNRLDELVEKASSSHDDEEAHLFARCRHVRAPRHIGFGGCTSLALSYVATPYVMVIQHDRTCLRPFDALRIVSAMRASQDKVRYVGLPTKASLSRCAPEHVQHRCGIRLVEDDVDPQVSEMCAREDIRLWPLLFWYDSTHICSLSHYREFVFAQGRVPGGGFPEDTLGQVMHSEICAAAKVGSWHAVHARYGTYLFLDGGGPMVGHLRGRRYVDEAEVARQGWRKNPQPPCGLDSKQAAEVCDEPPLSMMCCDVL